MKTDPVNPMGAGAAAGFINTPATTPCENVFSPPLVPGLALLFAFSFLLDCARANPVGGTVAQGKATFSSSGSQFTIQQTSAQAYINWQSFNIAPGETTTFVQPSSSSVTWNNINDPNPSQILGTLNANGYIVLQNQAGFVVGGQAVINTHGLLMTTAPIPMPDLSSGGPWQFNAPPPTASIVNYGQINADKGGTVFLIADNIQNNGTINASQATIGLYAGKQVLVSERPDGRGLSARVTLPSGSVDNSGSLIADAGTIAMNAQVVNQGGLVQANSVKQVNGIIELLASDSLNLNANSTISAQGDTTGTSPGGFVVLKSGNSFSDTSTTTINVSGGTQGGPAGFVEIVGQGVNANNVLSIIDNGSAASFSSQNHLLINPYDLTISTAATSASSSTPNFSVTDLANYSKVALFASDNITFKSVLTLTASQDPLSTISLEAGNNIIFNDKSGIRSVLTVPGGPAATQSYWSVDLSAGTQLPFGTAPNPANAVVINGIPRLDGIYLDGNASVQTLNGGINLWAANEVIVNPGDPLNPLSTGAVGSGTSTWNGIRTLRGGGIDVTAEYGDVNTGGNYNGYQFGQNAAPYYKVSTIVGGISTAAGGDVNISAGGNVTSFLPTEDNYQNSQYDGGTGAFGPGNVTITAGGNILGNYVLANGVGSISAGGDIGAARGTSGGFALSLIKGSWSVSAPGTLQQDGTLLGGNIYLQDARNPNGIFDDKGGNVTAFAGYHYFDYDPYASLTLHAANNVEITGANAPHGPPSAGGVSIPILLPPSFSVQTDSGDFILDTDVILFPSIHQNLSITTGGNFRSYVDPTQDPNGPQNYNVFTLEMSDSGAHQWDPSPADGTTGTFLTTDHASSPPGANDPNPTPVAINVGGSVKNVLLYTTKETEMNVTGDMFDSGFIGENLHSGDTTSINVKGRIYYPNLYSFVKLDNPIIGADPLNPGAWDSIFYLLVDPNLVANPIPSFDLSSTTALAQYGASLHVFQGSTPNPGFIYDPGTKQFGFQYQMRNSTILSALEGPLQIIQLDQFGNPAIHLGNANLGQDPTKYYFTTSAVSFVPSDKLNQLAQESYTAVQDASHLSPGFQIGGPGQFNITASRIDLGSSSGILSWGMGNGSTAAGGVDYSSLRNLTSSGAEVNVNVAGNLSMLTSTIASIDGGNVNVNCGGEVDLSLGDFAFLPPSQGAICYGIFTSGHSDVNVQAGGDINIGSARIATFNGGNVFVESSDGNVNAGNGANATLVVPVIYIDPQTGLLTSGRIINPKPFGSGIIASYPTAQWQTPGGNTLPGNITVETPNGNIVSTLGGIEQFALNGSIAGGPTITLSAGTPGGYKGNVDLGQGGVVGGTIDITAEGQITGLIVSHQNSTINAGQGFNGTLLAGGVANVSGGAGAVSGTVIGISGVNASGSGGISASLLGQNVSIGGGAAQSTLGTSATASSTTQAAAAQSGNDAKEQVASTNAENDDEKNKKAKPVLTRRVGRVTVILPPA